MKKAALLGIAMLSALALAACSSQAPQSSTSGASEVSTEVTQDSASDDAEGSTAEPPLSTEETPDTPEVAPELGTINYDEKVTGDEISLTSDDEKQLQNATEKRLIGIVCATMATDYHRTLCESAKERAQSLGFAAEIFDAQEDASRELQGFEGFLSKGAVAILQDSLGGEAITSQIDMAVERGTTVVQMSGRGFSEVGAITVAVEDATIAHAAGTAAGEYAQEHFDGSDIPTAMLDYPSIPSLVLLADGIEDAMRAVYPNIDMVGRFLGGTPENGQKSMESALQAHPDITAVVGINDAGLLGAYQALSVSGRTADDVFIVGIDCDPQAVDLIDQGSMYKACIDTNPAGTGALSVDVMALRLLGQSVPGTIEVPVNIYDGR